MFMSGYFKINIDTLFNLKINLFKIIVSVKSLILLLDEKFNR